MGVPPNGWRKNNNMKTKNILKNISFAIIVILITFSITKAGDLFPAGTTISSTFYTLGDIYDKLTDNTSSADEGEHDLNSSGTPASTFYTLKQIYEAIPDIDADKMLTTADYMGITGTIQTREISSTTPAISAGYYTATNLTTIDTDLQAGNILSGVNIFGVTGTSSPSQPLKTGQTTCYDVSGNPISCTGTGQDGDYQKGQARSYTDNSDGTITDNSTGLMWKKCSEGLSGSDCETGSATTMNWTTATSTCESDETAGYTDWRLPNIKELLSIVDYGKVYPAIDTDVFPATVGDYYWSSTAYFGLPNISWSVDFYDGNTGYGAKGDVDYVRCVR